MHCFTFLPVGSSTSCTAPRPSCDCRSRFRTRRTLSSYRGRSRTLWETRALSLARARQLMNMAKGDELLAIRDHAILRFYLYTGARIATGCKLKVNDFQQEGDEAMVRFHLKGGRVKTKGLHFAAAEAIQEYITAAKLESGPLFRPRSSSKGERLADRKITERSMNRLLLSYLERLPGAGQELEKRR